MRSPLDPGCEPRVSLCAALAGSLCDRSINTGSHHRQIVQHRVALSFLLSPSLRNCLECPVLDSLIIAHGHYEIDRKDGQSRSAQWPPCSANTATVSLRAQDHLHSCLSPPGAPSPLRRRQRPGATCYNNTWWPSNHHRRILSEPKHPSTICAMASRRPQLSITLPRNFTFHYTDGQAPQTPDGDRPLEPSQPSPPRPDRIQLRGPASIPRRRPRPSFTDALLQDVAIPSIELPEQGQAGGSQMDLSGVAADNGRLAPRPSQLRFVTPVREATPAKMPGLHDPYARRGEWSRSEEAESDGSMSRPASACSIFSDSSISSSETSVSFPSTAGGGASPERDAGGRFGSLTPRAKGKGKARAHPLASDPAAASGAPTTTRLSKQPKWTEEMDRHLWTTYLHYLQDPTVTPFRSDPGRAPPLGVCHRVAREAKRTWRGSRTALGPMAKGAASSGAGQALRNVNDEANAVASEALPAMALAGDENDTGRAPLDAPKAQIRWPRSESATRRRLRELCQQKATNSSLLQRALQTRSPTPGRGGRAGLASPFNGFTNSASFSTRALSMSLTTSTSASMRPDGPLARLAQEGSQPQSDEAWFGQPMGSSSSLGSTSSTTALHSASRLTAAPGATRLGSPFLPNQPPLATQPSFHSGRPHANTLGPYRTALRSPVRFTSTTLPIPGGRRRAQRRFDEDMSAGGDMRRNILEDLLGSPMFSGGNRRVRDRGFSLGDVSASERLANLFRPPGTHEARGQAPAQPEPQQPQQQQHQQHQQIGNAPAGFTGSVGPSFEGSSDSTTPTARPCQDQPMPEPIERLGSPFRSVTPMPRVATPTGHLRTGSVPIADPHDVGFSYMFDATSTARR